MLTAGQGVRPGSYDAALDGAKEALQALFSDPALAVLFAFLAGGVI